MFLSSDKRIHRMALSLNNEAVTLLQRGQYLAAKKAISSSLSMMETLLLGAGEEEDEQDENNKLLLLRSLEHACAKSPSWSSAISSPQSGHPPVDGDCDMSPFEIYAVDDNDFASLRSALQYGCSPSVYFPVLLRDEEPQSVALDMLTLSRQYASALYNAAVAYILCQEHAQFERCSPSNFSNQHFVDARRLLACSDSVLSSVVVETAKQEFRQIINHESRVQLLLVSGLVLNCLSLALMECKQPEQGSKALQAVENLTTVLDQYSTVFAPTFLSPAA